MLFLKRKRFLWRVLQIVNVHLQFWQTFPFSDTLLFVIQGLHSIPMGKEVVYNGFLYPTIQLCTTRRGHW